MHLDVIHLRNFYYRSQLGRATQAAIRAQVRHLWPEARGLCVVGYGFAAPLLRPYLAEAARVVSLMPSPQGVMPWPAGRPNVSVLCEETLWPVPGDFADRLLVLHGLDTSEHPAALLEECYRVLAPEGRALFIVPNRISSWARTDRTPFGFSRPYTPTQLEKRLAWHGFLAERHVTALYQPPSQARFWRRTAPLMERWGAAIPGWRGGGVLMLEVTKQVPRPRRPGLRDVVSDGLRVLEGIGKPEVKPVRV